MRRLASRGPELLGCSRMTVVFDGRRGVVGTDGISGVVDVRFTRDESADDMLVRMIARAQCPVTLVTSDRTLADRARASATAPLEVLGRERVYEGAAVPKRARRRAVPIAGDKPFGAPLDAKSITAELAGLWVAEEHSEDKDTEEGE